MKRYWILAGGLFFTLLLLFLIVEALGVPLSQTLRCGSDTAIGWPRSSASGCSWPMSFYPSLQVW
jgi:hypothetical protein